MRHTYDDSHVPPAPMVPVTVRPPDGAELEVRARMLLDTGADVSVVPLTLARMLEAVQAGERAVRGVGGVSVGRVPVYYLEFEVEGHRDLVEVVACGEELIAGRNWLSAFQVTLDGPQQTVALERPTAP